MKKPYYFVIVLALLILSIIIFYWHNQPLQSSLVNSPVAENETSAIKKNCFNQAEMAKQNAIKADNSVVMDGRLNITRADYDKIFKDENEKCLMANGIK